MSTRRAPRGKPGRLTPPKDLILGDNSVKNAALARIGSPDFAATAGGGVGHPDRPRLAGPPRAEGQSSRAGMRRKATWRLSGDQAASESRSTAGSR